MIKENNSLSNKIEELNIENSNLRSFLQLNQDFNSLKSFEDEIKKIEEEEANRRHLSPSREQEEQERLEKEETESLMKSSIRDNKRRVGRKRTESFHYSSFGDTSPDDEEAENSTLNKLRRKSVRVKMFSSGFSMQMANKNANNANKSSSASSSSSSDGENYDSVKEERKKEDEIKLPSLPQSRRNRVKSTDQANNFPGYSPPNNNKRARSNQKDEDYFAFGLKKGGGYKMSMQKAEGSESSPNKTEELSSSSFSMSKDNGGDNDDYAGCFNSKKKVAKSASAKEKRVRRTQSMVHDEVNDDESKELSNSKFKAPAKIKYSIHSIIEEEKSKSSSSSSVKSSDDLTLIYVSQSHNNKRKRSSF